MTNDGMPSDRERATMRRVTPSPASVLDGMLSRLFHRPRERRLCRLADETRTSASQHPFRFGERSFLPSLPLYLKYPAILCLRRLERVFWIARIIDHVGIGLGRNGSPSWVPYSFYLVRVLLGAAEQAFIPACCSFDVLGFPNRSRARVVAAFHGFRARREFHRLADLRSAAPARWLAWPSRVAMDVHPRGSSRDPVMEDWRSVFFARYPASSEMAHWEQRQCFYRSH